MRTGELRKRGFHSRKIAGLLDKGILSKLKTSVYERGSEVAPDESMLIKISSSRSCGLAICTVTPFYLDGRQI